MKDLIGEWKDEGSEIERLAKLLDEMKAEHYKDTVDTVAKGVSDEVTSEIDCLDCGNCCRTSVTDFTKGEIKRAAKHLSMTPKGFIKDYLMQDVDGTYITLSAPCPMLNTDNTCKIYEVRPAVCESYPHTQRTNFKNRVHAHQANLSMCPITYHTVKRLESELRKLSENPETEYND